MFTSPCVLKRLKQNQTIKMSMGGWKGSYFERLNHYHQNETPHTLSTKCIDGINNVYKNLSIFSVYKVQ